MKSIVFAVLISCALPAVCEETAIPKANLEEIQRLKGLGLGDTHPEILRLQRPGETVRPQPEPKDKQAAESNLYGTSIKAQAIHFASEEGSHPTAFINDRRKLVDFVLSSEWADRVFGIHPVHDGTIVVVPTELTAELVAQVERRPIRYLITGGPPDEVFKRHQKK